MEQKTGFKELILRLVAIVGLIAVLILGAWGIILLAFNLVGIFSGAVTLDSIFGDRNTPPQQQIATTTPTPTVTVNNNTNTTANTPSNTTANNVNTTPKPTTVVPSSQQNAVYTAAPRPAQMYGLPDLKVTITSVTSLSSVQGRTVVQFVVENAGTNVAHAGWNFNASLPLVPAYTYQSAPQQYTLYPGDKVAYTLTYDDPRRTQNQYAQPQTCYTYNGYQNVPTPCVIGYDQHGNPIYAPSYNQNYYQNPNYGYHPYGGTVTITLDPQNYVPESNEWNNTASKNVY